MAALEPSRTSATEPSSWWPLIAIIVGGFGTYAVLAVVLLVSATAARPSALLWLTGPALFLAAALVIGGVASLRERLVALGRLLVAPVDVRAERLSDAARDS